MYWGISLIFSSDASLFVVENKGIPAAGLIAGVKALVVAKAMKKKAENRIMVVSKLLWESVSVFQKWSLWEVIFVGGFSVDIQGNTPCRSANSLLSTRKAVHPSRGRRCNWHIATWRVLVAKKIRSLPFVLHQEDRLLKVYWQKMDEAASSCSRMKHDWVHTTLTGIRLMWPRELTSREKLCLCRKLIVVERPSAVLWKLLPSITYLVSSLISRKKNTVGHSRMLVIDWSL